MGTQFWWFYDVLIVAVAGGVIYHAAAKGFNQMVFRLIGCILAFVIGGLGSWGLSEPIYHAIYQHECEEKIQVSLEGQDLYQLTAEYITDHTDAADTDAETISTEIQSAVDGTEISDTLLVGVSGMLTSLTESRLNPKPDAGIYECLAKNVDSTRYILSQFEAEDRMGMAVELEKIYIRPDYTRMVGLAAFLILEAVIAIIVGIISASIGDKEELMHVRKLNRPLAVLAGLLEAAAWLLTITAVIRLMVSATDNMMMLFNEETIDKTFLFKYIFQMIK